MDRKEAEMRLKDDWYINLTGNLIVEHHKIDKFLEACGMAVEALQEPERKKGRWEDFDDDNSYLCTSCGEIWILNDGTPEENNMNYCPKCGADMRGEKE